MGKYKGLFWPAILGVKHMPKVKESEFTMSREVPQGYDQ